MMILRRIMLLQALAFVSLNRGRVLFNGYRWRHCLQSRKQMVNLFLISAVMVMNACSTLVAFFALVSKNCIPISSAKACSDHQNQW